MGREQYGRLFEGSCGNGICPGFAFRDVADHEATGVNIIEANRHHIEAALRHNSGTHAFEDIEKAVLSGEMQIWPTPNSCAVTEIAVYAKKKVLHVFLAAGDLGEIVGGLDVAMAWAKAQGCDSISVAGRKGWERVLSGHGFEPVAVMLERQI